MDGDPNDEMLVEQARTDRQAFGLLYDRYAKPVSRYCDRRLRDRALAEDATSQVFVRALSGLRGYRGGQTRSFRSWLFAIAHNVTSDQLGARREPRLAVDALDLVDTSPSPEELALRDEERWSLRALLDELTALQRQIIELRLEGLTGVEIAAVLGCRPDAIRSGQLRAITKLRDLLEVAPRKNGGCDEHA